MSYLTSHRLSSSVGQKEAQKPFFSKAISADVVTPPFFQAKLTINQPGDKYEQEADAMAEKVVSQSLTPHQSFSTNHSSSTTSLSRKCAECEKEGQLQRMEVPEEGLQAMPLMRAAQNGTTATPQLASQLSTTKGGGNSLPKGTLSSMNQAFGTDFSNVRIHTDSKAEQMSEGIRAKAFTHGSDIYFNKGQYNPGSTEGKRLLGHELTHVVQQGGEEIKRLIKDDYPWSGVVNNAILLAMRVSPNGTTLADLPDGVIVKVTGRNGNWLQVEVDTTQSGIILNSKARKRLAGNTLSGYVHNRYVDDATANRMERMETAGARAAWYASGGTGTVGATWGNDFADWASASTETTAPTVDPSTTINCWEMVLLAAYNVGALSWNWIHDLYINVPMSDWPDHMTRGSRQVYTPGSSSINRGDLVFFNGLAHVALATGSGDDVYTFWPPPDFAPGTYTYGTVDDVKVRSISSLAGAMSSPVIEFGPPAW